LGRKVHPVGFRVGITRDWQAKWYADQNYVQFLQEDLKLRQAIRSRYAGAGISLVEIDRQGDKILMNIYTSRPGVVIGRGGQRVDEMRRYLEDLIGSRIQLNIQEIRQPELDAYLVAVTVAEQIGRRVAYRRAMKQAIARTIEAGAKGIRINCSGRLAGAEIARREMLHQGQVPLHKLRADIDYGLAEAHTPLGRIGVKVWIYKGDILPEAVVEEAEEVPGEMVSEEPAGTIELVEKPVPPVTVEAAGAAPPVAVEEAVEEIEAKVEASEAEGEVPAVEAEAEVKKPSGRKKAGVSEAEGEVPAVEAEAEVKKPSRRKKAGASEAEGEVPAVEAEAEVKKPSRRKKAGASEADEATSAKVEKADATTETS